MGPLNEMFAFLSYRFLASCARTFAGLLPILSHRRRIIASTGPSREPYWLPVDNTLWLFCP